jgi:large subunit ribosomal protein L13e
MMKKVQSGLNDTRALSQIMDVNLTNFNVSKHFVKTKFINLILSTWFFFSCQQEAGIPRKLALTIGIPVDHRRKNRSVESLELNVARLKAYQSKLIIFPKRSNRPKKGDSDRAELTQAKQVQGPVIPIQQIWQQEEPRKITGEEKKFNAYATLRKARTDARLVGIREMRRKAKEEEEANKKK